MDGCVSLPASVPLNYTHTKTHAEALSALLRFSDSVKAAI